MVSAGGLKFDVETLRTQTGSTTLQSAFRRLNEILGSMFEYQLNRDGDIDTLILEATQSLEALAPRNEIESMLSTQMIATHLAAMECLKRAALPEQTFEGRQSGLKHANKLMSLYLRQVETLDKHRGKGQQKITVEHVNVEAGGQAIVGNVNTETKNPTGALPHKPGLTMPIVEENNLDQVETVPADRSNTIERSGKT